MTCQASGHDRAITEPSTNGTGMAFRLPRTATGAEWLIRWSSELSFGYMGDRGADRCRGLSSSRRPVPATDACRHLS